MTRGPCGRGRSRRHCWYRAAASPCAGPRPSTRPGNKHDNNDVSHAIVLPQQQQCQPYYRIAATTTTSALPLYSHYNDVCLTIVLPLQRCLPYHRSTTTTMSAIPSYSHYNDVRHTIVVPQQRCQPYHRNATTTMSALLS